MRRYNEIPLIGELNGCYFLIWEDRVKFVALYKAMFLFDF